MKKMSVITLSILLSLLALSCGSGTSSSGSGTSNDQYPRFTSGDNEMVNFIFPASKNVNFSGDVSGVITDSVITLEVPNKAVLTSLVAEYTTNSTSVEVNGTAQSSGVTTNDFSKAVEYTVIAENGNKKVYSVVVNKAPSGEKELKSFSLNGISGVIDESAGSVSVVLPAHTVITSLAASFDSDGKSVTVGGKVQKSGETENDYTNPVKYLVTAEDLTTKEYTVTVTVLKDTAREINTFTFYKADNAKSNLSADVSGIFNGNNITVEVPYGTTVNALKAYFEYSGDSVMVGTVLQKASENENDFSGTVKYVVTAEDGNTTDYNVDVTVLKSDARSISEFILDGEPAVIDGNTITAVFPATKVLTSLKSAFVTSGVEVTVDSVIQKSGETLNDFSSPVTYKVKADNGLTTDYTVNVTKAEGIAGLWNFEYGTDGSYTISGATTVDGLSGNALHFNRGNYVLVPDSDTLTLADAGTIEVLIKADSHQPFAGVVHKGVKKDFSDESYSLQFWGDNSGTDGTLRFSVFNSKGGYNYVESTTKLALNKWYYVVATWDSTDIRIYVNGALENKITNSIGKVLDSTGGLVIGAQLPIVYTTSWSNLVFNGTIDKVQIYGSAISESEISEKYSVLQLTSSSALTAYILAVAVKNYAIIGGIFGILVLVLITIFMHNRKKDKSSI